MRLILILSIFLASCGSSYHLKKAKRHLNKAVEKGASIDSILQIKYDTVQVEALIDSTFMELAIDTVRIRELCDSVRKEPARVIPKIQKLFTNEVSIDTTYQLKAEIQDSTYYLPIKVTIQNNVEGFSYKVSIPQVKVPVKTEQMNILVTQKIPWWIWVIIGAMGFSILVLIIKR